MFRTQERDQPAETEQAAERIRSRWAEHGKATIERVLVERPNEAIRLALDADDDTSMFDDDDIAELLGCGDGEAPRRIDSEALFTSLVEPHGGRRYWGDADG